jgi:hypothetical protein
MKFRMGVMLLVPLRKVFFYVFVQYQCNGLSNTWRGRTMPPLLMIPCSRHVTDITAHEDAIIHYFHDGDNVLNDVCLHGM